MVGLIVRLRFAMWRTAMSRSALHLASSILGGLAALGVLALLGPGLLLLSQRPLRITALTVPLFTVITLMWTVLSLIATGVDSILDPARFSVLPLRAGELARGLLAAACTGIPAVMLIGLALAQVGSWLAHPAAVPAALLGGVLGVLTAILLSRAVTSALARVMTTRVGRVLGAAVVAVVTLIPLTMNTLLTTGSLGADLSSFDATQLRRRRVVDPVRMGVGASRSTSPRGGGCRSSCTWRSRSSLRRGACTRSGSGCWRARSPRRSPAPAASGSAAGGCCRCCSAPHRRPRSRPAGCAPGTATAGWSASRCAPPCCRSSSCVQAVFTDTPGLAGIGIVTLAVFAGLTLMNDLAFDGPAWWLHVAVGVRGLGGPARPRDRLDRGVRAGRRAHLRRERGARRHLEPGVVADRGRGVVLRQPRPGRRGGCGAAGHGTPHRGNPFAATSGGAAQGCLTADRVVRRADAAHPPGRRRGDPDVRLGGRPVGGAGGRARSTGSACSPVGWSSGAPASTGARPSCSASSPPPRSDLAPNFPARSRNLHVRTGSVLRCDGGRFRRQAGAVGRRRRPAPGRCGRARRAPPPPARTGRAS